VYKATFLGRWLCRLAGQVLAPRVAKVLIEKE
jgi:hypothetical protein